MNTISHPFGPPRLASCIPRPLAWARECRPFGPGTARPLGWMYTMRAATKPIRQSRYDNRRCGNWPVRQLAGETIGPKGQNSLAQPAGLGKRTAASGLKGRETETSPARISHSRFRPPEVQHKKPRTRHMISRSVQPNPACSRDSHSLFAALRPRKPNPRIGRRAQPCHSPRR